MSRSTPPSAPRTAVSGLHHLILQASERRALFSQPQDYAALEEKLLELVKREAIAVHAYCWRRRSLHLAVEFRTQTVEMLVRTLANTLSCNFRTPVHVEYVEPASGLLRLVRHIHMEPVRSGLVRSPSEYRLSSDSAYRGEVTVRWLTTSRALQMLDSDVAEARRAYERLMQTRPRTTYPMRKLSFTQEPAGQVLETIVDSVAQKLHVDRSLVISPSRRRLFSMARALIAWEATRRHVATLSEVGRVLQRDPSTLCTGIQRYRELRPELFNATTTR